MKLRNIYNMFNNINTLLVPLFIHPFFKSNRTLDIH